MPNLQAAISKNANIPRFRNTIQIYLLSFIFVRFKSTLEQSCGIDCRKKSKKQALFYLLEVAIQCWSMDRESWGG